MVRSTENALPPSSVALPTTPWDFCPSAAERHGALPCLAPRDALAAPAVMCMPSRQARRITTAGCMVRRSRSFVSCHQQCCRRTPFKGARTLSSLAACHGRGRACPTRPHLYPWPPVVNVLAGYAQSAGRLLLLTPLAHQLGRRRQCRSTSTCAMNLSTSQRRSTSRARPQPIQ